MKLKLPVRKVRSILLLTLSVALAASLSTHFYASAANTFTGSNTLASVDSSGTVSDAASYPLGVSTDGNVVLFRSGGSNLPGYSSAGWSGVFVHNFSGGTTTRVDSSSSDTPANGPESGSPGALSPTGRYAAFTSGATNLIDGVTSPTYGIYLKDLQTGVTTSLLTDGSGIPIQVGTYAYPTSISNDGRFVLISTTKAYLFVPGTRAGYNDIVLVDTVAHTTKLLYTPVSGALQNAGSYPGGMSCDGAFVVFSSLATNLVSNYSGSNAHIFLADLRNGGGITDLTSGETVVSGSSTISCDGETIAFGTQSRNLVTPTPSSMDSTSSHMIEYNRITGAYKYVDSDSSGNFSQPQSSATSVSDKGDMVFRWPFSVGSAQYAPLMMKHVSDGSGTLEHVEKTPSGSYLTNYDTNNGNLYLKVKITPDSKYIVYPTRESCQLITSGGSCSSNVQAVRSATGL